MGANLCPAELVEGDAGAHTARRQGARVFERVEEISSVYNTHACACLPAGFGLVFASRAYNASLAWGVSSYSGPLARSRVGSVDFRKAARSRR